MTLLKNNVHADNGSRPSAVLTGPDWKVKGRLRRGRCPVFLNPRAIASAGRSSGGLKKSAKTGQNKEGGLFSLFHLFTPFSQRTSRCEPQQRPGETRRYGRHTMQLWSLVSPPLRPCGLSRFCSSSSLAQPQCVTQMTTVNPQQWCHKISMRKKVEQMGRNDDANKFY